MTEWVGLFLQYDVTQRSAVSKSTSVIGGDTSLLVIE